MTRGLPPLLTQSSPSPAASCQSSDPCSTCPSVTGQGLYWGRAEPSTKHEAILPPPPNTTGRQKPQCSEVSEVTRCLSQIRHRVPRGQVLSVTVGTTREARVHTHTHTHTHTLFSRVDASWGDQGPAQVTRKGGHPGFWRLVPALLGPPGHAGHGSWSSLCTWSSTACQAAREMARCATTQGGQRQRPLDISVDSEWC